MNRMNRIFFLTNLQSHSSHPAKEPKAKGVETQEPPFGDGIKQLMPVYMIIRNLTLKGELK